MLPHIDRLFAHIDSHGASFLAWLLTIVSKHDLLCNRRRIKRLAKLCAKGEDKEESLRSVRASFYGYTKYCSAGKTWREIEMDLDELYQGASAW
jgi:hypothetical protein